MHSEAEVLTSRYRYRILALLFFATTINYLDRSTIGVLGPTLRDQVFHWSMKDYGYITTAFQLAYAIGLIMMGAVIDKLGVKKGYLLSVVIWSAFGLATALIQPAFGLIGFIIARFGLGLGEAGSFPSCVKAVAEWFPKRDRAFATGIFNAGSNIGAIIAPLAIPLIVASNGDNWQFAFLFSSIFTVTWIVCWLRWYGKPEDHPKVSRAEIAYINSDGPEAVTEKVPWSRLLPHRQTWGIALLKMTDAAWWFYLFWGGMFFADRFHLDIKGLGLPLIIIYLVADVGSVAGGWLSGALLNRGVPLAKARKLALLIAAVCIFPVIFATQTDNQWIAVLLIAVAAGGHQAWSANVYTLASDMFPKNAVGSVVGIAGMVGAGTSMVASLTLGQVLKAGDASGYAVPFLLAGSAYGVVLLLAHLFFIPDLKPAKL